VRPSSPGATRSSPSTNLITGRRENLAQLDGEPGFSFVECDVSAEMPVTGDVDFIMHFASPASPFEYLAHPFETLDAGSLGTRRCLELARATGARFLLASTSEIYGEPREHPQTESYWGTSTASARARCTTKPSASRRRSR